jgi:hypothetical protein
MHGKSTANLSFILLKSSFVFMVTIVIGVAALGHVIATVKQDAGRGGKVLKQLGCRSG